MDKRIFTTTTNSPIATRELGKKLGNRLKGTETLALRSDLGGGKTTFVQGLAEGLGITRAVVSPTFVLEKIYARPRSRKPNLYHYDLYRLDRADVVNLDLAEIIGEAVVAVEWAERAEKIMPDNAIWINITAPTATMRKFVFEYDDKQKYLFE